MTNRLAFFALCLLVFTIPWEKSLVLPGIGTVARLAGAAALIAWSTDALRRRSVRSPNLLLVSLAAFLGWSALTWLWSLDPAATLARVFTYIQLLTMTWLIWDLSRTESRQTAVLQAWVAGSCVASLATVIRYAQGLQTYWRRYAAPGFDPNDLGITLALAIPPALFLALRSGDARIAWLNRAAAALACTAILLTASRTSLIAAFVALVFTAVVWRHSDRAQRWSGAGLAALLALGAVVLAPAASRERLATTAQELTRGTLHQRTQIWKAGLKTFRRTPVAGAGAGAYPDAVKPLIGVPPVPGHEYVAHNTFLSVLIETGIAGFSLYAAALAIAAMYVWALASPQRALWTVTLAVLAIGASTLTWEHRKPVWLILALVMTDWARSFQTKDEL